MTTFAQINSCLKRLVACILIMAVLAQTFSKGFILVDFFANRDFIAKNLCENKDKPQLKCCGKCQLNKKLKQDETPEGQGQNTNRKVSNPSFELFAETNHSSSFLHIAGSLIHTDQTQVKHPVDQPSSHFHPPGA